MSSDGGSFLSVTPDFVYIVKIGDYQHVLRPADQKSSDNLNLARQAVANIDMARNLLTERGPFLVSEKQQKMDELICDTEEAINRVMKLLQPARVEQLSEESIRINTKNAWALEDEPKSAATFGRLQISHDKLKTVLHDLKNIEATAQLDNCEVRATTSMTPLASSHSRLQQPPPPSGGPKTQQQGPNKPLANKTIGPPSSSQFQQRRASSLSEPRNQQENPNNLIAWKRNRQRQSRQTLSSDDSSVSGHASDDHPRSPASSQGNRLMGVVDGSAQQLRGASNGDTNGQRGGTQDNISESSMGRLSVIHELDGAPMIASPSGEASSKADDGRVDSAKVLGPSNHGGTEHDGHGRTRSSGQVNLPSTASSPPESGLPRTAETPQPTKGMKIEGFADYRERNKRERESRQEPQPESKVAPPSSSAKLSTAPQQTNPRNEPDLPPPPRRSASAAATTQGGVSAIQNQGQQRPTMQKPVQTAAVFHDRNPASTRRESAQFNGSDVAVREPTVNREQASPADESRMQSAAPVTASRPPAGAENLQHTRAPTLQHLHTVVPAQSSTILSPSHIQNSPLAQTPSSATRETEMFQQPQSPTKSHEIFLIDPVLTRLPSLLRPGQRGRSKVLPPYPVSDAGSDHTDEDQVTELPRIQQRNGLIERSITAPPAPQPSARATHPQLQVLQTADDHTHQRSFSDPIVPQINLTRAPTIPRKPVPYRNSMLLPGAATREHSAQLTVRPQSEFFPSAAVPQHGISGPPSPLHSDRDNNQAPLAHSSNSLNSLSVQQPSSLGSSRRSSVSAEEQPQPQPSQGTVPSPRPTPPASLAVRPTAPQTPQASAYQVQSATMATNQQSWTASQPDYRSPAFQQSRHFVDPSHNMHLAPSEQPPQPQTSRFRDSDQARPLPYAPVRSTTEPVERHVLQQVRDQPRRASDQGQIPLMRGHLHNQPLPQFQQPAPPHLNSPFQGRAQLVYVKQQPRQNPNPGLHPPVDRSTITRTAPPTDAEYVTKRLPLPDIGRGASLNYNAGRQNAKDKDLFGRQVWRADLHDQQSRQQQQPPPPTPQQHQLQQSQQLQQQRLSYHEHEQPRQQPQAQPRVQPRPGLDETHQHDCNCDDQVQVQPPPANPKTSAPREEVQYVRLTPVHEGQAAPSVKASAEIPLYPAQPKPQPQLQPQSQPRPQAQPQLQPTNEPAQQSQPTKKRTSWLAHQANRNRLIKGRR